MEFFKKNPTRTWVKLADPQKKERYKDPTGLSKT
jgi:hypothetical protein